MLQNISQNNNQFLFSSYCQSNQQNYQQLLESKQIFIVSPQATSPVISAYQIQNNNYDKQDCIISPQVQVQNLYSQSSLLNSQGLNQYSQQIFSIATTSASNNTEEISRHIKQIHTQSTNLYAEIQNYYKNSSGGEETIKTTKNKSNNYWTSELYIVNPKVDSNTLFAKCLKRKPNREQPQDEEPLIHKKQIMIENNKQQQQNEIQVSIIKKLPEQLHSINYNLVQQSTKISFAWIKQYLKNPLVIQCLNLEPETGDLNNYAASTHNIPKNIEQLVLDQSNISLHKQILNIDLKDYKQETLEYVNFLKQSIFEIVQRYLKIPITNKIENMKDIQYEYRQRAYLGLQQMFDGRIVERF